MVLLPEHLKYPGASLPYALLAPLLFHSLLILITAALATLVALFISLPLHPPLPLLQQRKLLLTKLKLTVLWI
jgi:hypothetical protein